MQRARQFGYTLFEITFVIVIICLLASIMLIGQNLTVSSKVRRLEHDLYSLQTAAYGSRELLQPTHGNFRKVTSHLPDSAAVNNNGKWDTIIVKNWRSTSGETFDLWQYGRPSGLAQSPTDMNSNAYAPVRSSAGIIAVSDAPKVPIAGLKGNYIICTSNIAGRLAKQLDLEMDDGNTASGSIRVSDAIGSTGIATDSIVNDSTYIVCQGI